MDCRQNSINLIVVGLVFGTLWLGGLLSAGFIMRKLTQDAIGAAYKKSLGDLLRNPADRQLAVGYVLSLVASNIGFLGLVIGMPILGSQRSKLACRG